MSDTPTYPILNDLEFRVTQANVDVLEYDDGVVAVFGSPEKVNIRRSKDKTKGERSLPEIAVAVTIQPTMPRTNEYWFRLQFFCNSQADNDPDAQQAGALLGACREALHQDSPAGTPGRFDGDCQGYLIALNKTTRGIVFHQIHEGDEQPNDKGRTRGLILNVDAWGYPGSP